LGATAQPSDPKLRADASYKEGVELAKAGKTDAALAKFEASYSLTPSGMTVFQIARMEQLLGRHALALQHFREALNEATLTTDARREAERAVDDLKKRVGVITLDVPQGATATVDGNDVDPKEPVEVVPGLHVVKIRLAAQTKSVDVTSPAGVVTPVKLRFTEEAPPATPTPPPKKEEPPQPSFWTTGRIVGVGTAAAGVVSVGLGIGFQLASSGSSSDAQTIRDSLPPPRDSACNNPANGARCSELRSAVDSQHSQEGLRTGFLVAGGLLLAAGAVVFLVSPPEKRGSAEPLKAGFEVVPVVSAREDGVAIVGRF
jgi:hypothetical protein